MWLIAHMSNESIAYGKSQYSDHIFIRLGGGHGYKPPI